MNKELERIKEMLASAPKKRRKRVYSALLFLFLMTGLLILTGNNNYSCRISQDQKSFLKARIEKIAASGKTSKYMLYRHLKAQIKYETIGKMPCHTFDTASKFLDDYEERINANR